MMSEPQVLFVFGAQACVPADPLLAARRLGYRTAVLGPTMACGVPEELVDRYEQVALFREDAVVGVAGRLHQVDPFHAVVGYDDPAVPVVARIAAALGLPGNPVSAADRTRDKVWMKEALTAAGLPLASYVLAGGEDDAVAWARESGYPVVVKPVRGSASQGVVRADDEAGLRAAYRVVRRIVRDHGLDTGGRSDAEQLVEEYLDGSEFSVELLVSEGEPHVLCTFEKPEPLEGPYFEETIYLTPARVAAHVKDEMEAQARRAVAALGLCSGAAHCELRLTSRGPFVLEVAGRTIGGACSRVFRHVLGEDIHTSILRVAAGERVVPPSPGPSAAGAMMLPVPKEGRLAAVGGIESAREVPGIVDVIVSASPGDVILQFPHQSCYVGFLTAAAATPEEVELALGRAARSIEMQLDPISCERWERPIVDHVGYEAPPTSRIESLEGWTYEDARRRVRAVVAPTSFGELPAAMAAAEASRCVDWLERGARGETSPSSWFVSDDDAVALGSADGDTCYVSCLGVLPHRRRTGLGEALVRSVMGLFAERGCSRIEVLLDPREPAANGLYRRLGFAPMESSAPDCCSC